MANTGQSKFCTQCGAPNATTAKFCEACGHPFGATSSSSILGDDFQRRMVIGLKEFALVVVLMVVVIVVLMVTMR
jgi:uncharacterized membrane protein YvbJ